MAKKKKKKRKSMTQHLKEVKDSRKKLEDEHKKVVRQRDGLLHRQKDLEFQVEKLAMEKFGLGSMLDESQAMIGRLLLQLAETKEKVDLENIPVPTKAWCGVINLQEEKKKDD